MQSQAVLDAHELSAARQALIITQNRLVSVEQELSVLRKVSQSCGPAATVSPQPTRFPAVSTSIENQPQNSLNSSSKVGSAIYRNEQLLELLQVKEAMQRQLESLQTEVTSKDSSPTTSVETLSAADHMQLDANSSNNSKERVSTESILNVPVSKLVVDQATSNKEKVYLHHRL